MSFDYTGSFSGSFSGSFTGEIVAVNGVLSSSAQVAASLPAGVISSSNQVTYDGTGLISSSNQVNYTQVKNKPTTISAFQKNSIVANNRFREVTYPQISSSVSTRLTDLEARESSASFSSRIATLESSVDNTGSDSQTLSFNDGTNALTISDGNTIDLSSLAGGGGGGSGLALTASDEGGDLSKNVRSLDFVGNAVEATGAGNAITVTINTGSLPSGVVSGSSQVSYNSISDVPSGLISSSDQILPIATSSITNFDTEVSRSVAEAGFGSGGDTIPDGTISSSAQIISSLPSGTVSGSSQVDYDSISNVPIGILSSSTQVVASLPSGVVSGSSQVSYNSISDVPSGLVSGSSQIDLSQAIGTASFAVTASYAISASHEIVTEVSSSHAVSADTASFISDSFISASAVRSGFGSGGGSSDTASFVEGVTNFDGNRIVSNTNLPSGIYNVNFGTSGSISQFIEEVFFPNSVPSITTSGFTIQEFEVSGSSVGTVSATDAEGQSVTFRTASSYTDDLFRISTSGAVTLNTKSTASINTDNTPGSGSHPFQVEAVDTFNGVGSRTIYIRVNPNTAPKWRQTSVSGTVITTFTQSLNEDSVAGNNKARVFFSDDESDTITINTGSLSSDFTDKFSLDIESTYVQLNQTTASLDYEDITQFSFVLTASDQHYGDGDDTDSIAYLPFQVAVVDNVGPTANDQSITGVNENSSNGANAGSITATDPEGNTITFSNFTLQEANLDGGSDIKSTLNGTSLYDPTRDPFQCSTAGVVTRKNGVFLNSDVANNYIYQVTVTDAFNTTTDTALITIPIADDAQSSVTDNWTNPYIIESALDGDSVRINTNGRTGTIAQWSSATSQRWEVSSENDLIEVTTLTGSTTQLRVKNDISGSANSFDGDNRISVELTASEHGFETTKQYIDVDVRVAINNAPDIIFSNTSANLNTNGARSGSLLTTISFSDTEGDTLNHSAFTFTDPTGQLNSVRSGNTYLIQAANNLSGSTTYDITASIQDTHAFRTNTEEHTFTIAQAGIGTLTGDTTSFVISTAVSGANLQDATGEGNGNDSDLNVSYSPNYNSQTVQSFTSSNSAIAVDNNGGLSMNVDLSTTTSGSGDTINTDITFRDQYDNIGSGSVTITVFAPDVLVYGYGWDGGSAATEATAIASMGDAGADGVGINSGSVIAHLQSGSLGGNFNPSYVGGTMTLHQSSSLSTMSDTDDTGISTLGYFNFSSTSQRLILIFPSSSVQGGKPASMYDGVPPDSTGTANEYYVYAKDAAIPGTIGTGVYYFDTETAIDGITNWGMIFAEGENTNNSRYYLMPDTASAP